MEITNESTCCRVLCQSTTHENIPIVVTSTIVNKLLNTCTDITLSRFKVDDLIRVSKFKTIFEKGYTSNWTTEVFRIVKVQKTNPVTYLLEDYRGKLVAEKFYKYELHRVANPDVVEKVLRKKGNDVYVK